jgi:hypothetical protein
MDTRQERAKNKIRADVKSHIKAKAEYQKSSSNVRHTPQFEDAEHTDGTCKRATYDKDVEKKVTVSSPITGAVSSTSPSPREVVMLTYTVRPSPKTNKSRTDRTTPNLRLKMCLLRV